MLSVSGVGLGRTGGRHIQLFDHLKRGQALKLAEPEQLAALGDVPRGLVLAWGWGHPGEDALGRAALVLPVPPARLPPSCSHKRPARGRVLSPGAIRLARLACSLLADSLEQPFNLG